jgi:hypothetical protein
MTNATAPQPEPPHLKYCRFAIDETPVCLWSYDLDGENKRYLNGIDPDYFEMIAAHLAKDGFVPPDGLRRALALRAVYGQGTETLLALLCAAAQAPDCVPGWMGRYRNEELRSALSKITGGQPLRNRFDAKAVTWESLSEFVHRHVGFGGTDKKRAYTSAFAMFWRRLANEHLKDHVADEYNAIKHGLRTRSGGFSIAIGREDTPGTPCPPEKMQSLGGSNFGTSVIAPEKIEGTKRHYRFAHRVEQLGANGARASTLTHLVQHWQPRRVSQIPCWRADRIMPLLVAGESSSIRPSLGIKSVSDHRLVRVSSGGQAHRTAH